MNKQSGFGIVALMVAVALVALIGYYSLSRLTNNDPEGSASEAIEQAQESVDKANEAKNKAGSIIESADGAVDSLNQ